MPTSSALPPPTEIRSPVRWWPGSPRAALLAVVGVALLLRLIWAATSPLNKDEGYHYLYTVHPALSYFDHPPMMAVMTAAGLAVCGGAVNTFSIRLGFAVLSAGTSWLLGRWTGRRWGEWAGVYAALWWNLSPYYGIGAGGQVMPDGPFLFFALLTMFALHRAVVERPGKLLLWVWVGLAWGASLLSKYHAVFLPAGAVLYLLLTPSARRVLRSPGPYLAVLIGVILFSPVLYWNATNGWASFAFQGERAVGYQFRPEGTAQMFLGQMGFLTPALWTAAVVVLVATVRSWRSVTPTERLLVCLAVVPLVFFFVVSFVRKASPHWTLIGFVPLMPLVGVRCVGWYERWPRTARWLTAGWAAFFVVALSLFVIHARTGLFAAVVPFQSDPAKEQCGWESIVAKLEEHQLVGRPNTFVFTADFNDSGQLGFAMANRTPTTCYQVGDARGFAFWSKPDDWVGRDGVLVALDDHPWEPQHFDEYFESIEPVDEFWMTRNGQPVRPVRLFLCRNQIKPFPFTYPLPRLPKPKV